MIVARKTSVRSAQNKHDGFKNKQNEATVYLYGEIGGWWGIDPQQWIMDFNSLDADVIHVRIDSGGGDVFAARSMKTAVMQHKATVIGHIDGLAASAASFFAMGCDEIEMTDGAFIMVHNAMSMLDILGYFNIDDLKELCDEMSAEMERHVMINEAIANDYMKKTKKPQQEVCGWMDKETWFPAKDALANGLIDRIYDGAPVEGNYDLSVFNNVPEPLKLRNQTNAKRAIEKALRDAGCSNKQAKAILAKGFTDDLRDEEPPAAPPEGTPQRDVAVTQPKSKDRVHDLLIRAEIIAPKQAV